MRLRPNGVPHVWIATHSSTRPDARSGAEAAEKSRGRSLGAHATARSSERFRAHALNSSSTSTHVRPSSDPYSRRAETPSRLRKCRRVSSSRSRLSSSAPATLARVPASSNASYQARRGSPPWQSTAPLMRSIARTGAAHASAAAPSLPTSNAVGTTRTRRCGLT